MHQVVTKDSKHYKKLYVVNSVLSEKDDDQTPFYLTKYPYCSSSLEPDTVNLKALGKRLGLDVVRIPIFKQFGAGPLWNMPRQLNRNLLTPLKRWFSKGTYIWFKSN